MRAPSQRADVVVSSGTKVYTPDLDISLDDEVAMSASVLPSHEMIVPGRLHRRLTLLPASVIQLRPPAEV